MAKINWTAEAEQWLREIHYYIAGDNPAAASRTVAGIYQKIQVLSRFPEYGIAMSMTKVAAFESFCSGTIESHI